MDGGKSNTEQPYNVVRPRLRERWTAAVRMNVSTARTGHHHFGRLSRESKAGHLIPHLGRPDFSGAPPPRALLNEKRHVLCKR